MLKLPTTAVLWLILRSELSSPYSLGRNLFENAPHSSFATPRLVFPERYIRRSCLRANSLDITQPHDTHTDKREPCHLLINAARILVAHLSGRGSFGL